MKLGLLCIHEQLKKKKANKKSIMAEIKFKKKKVESCKRCIRSDNPMRKTYFQQPEVSE